MCKGGANEVNMRLRGKGNTEHRGGKRRERSKKNNQGFKVPVT